MSVRIPKYRLHKGSGQALIQINGHRIYLGTYNSPESKEKYRQYVARLFAPGATFEECHSDDLLLINSLILQYYRYAQTYYVKNGEQTDEVYGTAVGAINTTPDTINYPNALQEYGGHTCPATPLLTPVTPRSN
jgi:hypothetical protein